MKILLGVVAHQAREIAAHELACDNTASVMNVDDGALGCEANHLFVLHKLAELYRYLPLDDSGAWCMVLEDDAMPVRDFRIHLRGALKSAPEPIVGLYLGTSNPSGPVQRQIRQAVVAAHSKDRAWIVGDCLIGSVGYAVRGELMGEMIEGIKNRGEELPLRISRWAQDAGVGICYTQPSLVDHHDGLSVIAPYRVQPGVVPTPRKAWRFGVRDNWDTPAVRMGHCPNWSAA